MKKDIKMWQSRGSLNRLIFNETSAKYMGRFDSGPQRQTGREILGERETRPGRETIEEVRERAAFASRNLNTPSTLQKYILGRATYDTAVSLGRASSTRVYRSVESENRTVDARRGMAFQRREMCLVQREVAYAKKHRLGAAEFQTRLAGAFERDDTPEAEVLIAVLDKGINVSDPQFREKIGQILQEINASNFLQMSVQDQEAFAQALIDKYRSKDIQDGLDAKKVRKVIASYLNIEQGRQFVMSRVLGNEEMTKLFMSNFSTSKDPQKAMLAVLEKAPPELKDEYKKYLERWRASNVADVFNAMSVPGSNSLPAAQTEVSKVVNFLNAQNGIYINPTDAGNRREIQYGGLLREIAIYDIDGKTQIIIEDPYADSGSRGPINPEEVPKELWNMQIDTFFSEKFAQFSPRGAEGDPSQVVDESLLKIVRAVFPEIYETHSDRLETTHKQWLSNLARLMATPDSNHIFVEDRVRYFKDTIIHNEKHLFLARRELKKMSSTEDKPTQPHFSLSDLEASFRRTA